MSNQGDIENDVPRPPQLAIDDNTRYVCKLPNYVLVSICCGSLIMITTAVVLLATLL